jgi:hypothetical protein
MLISSPYLYRGTSPTLSRVIVHSPAREMFSFLK